MRSNGLEQIRTLREAYKHLMNYREQMREYAGSIPPVVAADSVKNPKYKHLSFKEWVMFEAGSDSEDEK